MIQAVYNRAVRPLIRSHPYGRKYRTLAGVPVRDAALTDLTDTVPDYKRGFVRLIREHVESGDHVVEIGGGSGVLTTIAAWRGAGIDTYEPAREMVRTIDETVSNAGVIDRVRIHHAEVGDVLVPYGDINEADQVAVHDLPECDVLMMDCEGAELSILKKLTIRPATILVETHPEWGSTVETLGKRVGSKGYELESVRGDPIDHTEAMCFVGGGLDG